MSVLQIRGSEHNEYAFPLMQGPQMVQQDPTAHVCTYPRIRSAPKITNRVGCAQITIDVLGPQDHEPCLQHQDLAAEFGAPIRQYWSRQGMAQRITYPHAGAVDAIG